MPDLRELIPKRVVYALPGMEQVPVRKDLVYRQVGGQDLRLDIYYPPDLTEDGRLPAVVFVHGDGPPEILRSAKDWGAYVSWGQLTAMSGMIAVTFNHRSSEGRTRLPEAAADVEALVAYVLGHAAQLRIDPDRVGIWTCSAGGPKGVRAALQGPPPYVRCLVSLYALLDLEPLRPHIPSDVPDAVLQEFSPIRHLGPQSPPMLVVRAGLDHPALNDAIDRFVLAALKQNLTIDVYNHAAGRHAFDILDNDERSRTIIAHILAFLQRHLLT